ncbi:MAG TPA: FAD-binding oxidoreductase [Caulobacteraceae bacterium]|jgi:FAD/FMN-containing dehydrogenase|nr:FAD-binding oxidoreductase [Caulobacteraceae bacterium]
MAIPPAPETLARLKAAVGPQGWSDDPERLAPKLTEWRDAWRGSTPLLMLPASTAEVAAVVGICAATGTAITPQGGNTGLVGGQTPQGEVLLSLDRMRAVRSVDAGEDVLVVEAGATLAAAQAAAAAVDRLFPLSLASDGSATVGGAIATNAGGIAVLRYGTMRALVLGIEAVLPDGSVFEGLKRLRKDNTGYDLKQLLIGAEGTLGVVTAAALRLFPVMRSRAVAVVGVPDPAAALGLLTLARTLSGGMVEAFELMGRLGVALAVKHANAREPLESAYPWYVLIEIAAPEAGAAEGFLQRILEAGLQGGLVLDAAVAQNQSQAHALWAVREHQSAGQKPEGAAWKHDIAVPVGAVPDFIVAATEAAEASAPGARVVAFGHMGDGNIHFDVLPPVGGDPAAHTAAYPAASRRIHDIALALGGTISAEHGLGVLKTTEALRYKPGAEVAAMRAIRQALDPGRIMNPRVLF